MTQSDVCFDQASTSSDSQVPITIDPLSFFQYAATGKDRWQELIGLMINHCTFGLGTIKKIDGDYIYVDLPQRQGKKHLTEFGLDSFQRGFFSNLQIPEVLLEKITAAAACPEPPPPAALEADAPPVPLKKKRKTTKTTKKAATS